MSSGLCMVINVRDFSVALSSSSNLQILPSAVPLKSKFVLIHINNSNIDRIRGELIDKYWRSP